MILAQTSDLHLRIDGNILRNSLFGSPLIDLCIEHINALRPHPDVVLATGDLVNTPTDQDYEALRTALDELSVPVYVIPGNHDGRDELRETFSDWGYLPEGPFLHYTVEHYPPTVDRARHTGPWQNWRKNVSRPLVLAGSEIVRTTRSSNLNFYASPAVRNRHRKNGCTWFRGGGTFRKNYF